MTRKRKTPRYKWLIRQLGMSQVGAARFAGIAARQSRRLASGQRDMPVTLAMLLELMHRFKMTPNQARKMAGLQLLDNLNRKAGRPNKKSRQHKAGGRRK